MEERLRSKSHRKRKRKRRLEIRSLSPRWKKGERGGISLRDRDEKVGVEGGAKSLAELARGPLAAAVLCGNVAGDRNKGYLAGNGRPPPSSPLLLSATDRNLFTGQYHKQQESSARRSRNQRGGGALSAVTSGGLETWLDGGSGFPSEILDAGQLVYTAPSR